MLCKPEYARCNESNKITCYDPKEVPYQWWIEVRTNNEGGRLIGKSRITTNLSKPLSIEFDVCDAASDDYYTPCGTMSWVKNSG